MEGYEEYKEAIIYLLQDIIGKDMIKMIEIQCDQIYSKGYNEGFEKGIGQMEDMYTMIDSNEV